MMLSRKEYDAQVAETLIRLRAGNRDTGDEDVSPAEQVWLTDVAAIVLIKEPRK